MIELASWLTYLAACIAVVIVPGPTVTVIIANSMRHGARAGLMNVAGTQAGIAMMVAILAFGFSAVVALLGEAFFWLKLVGAAYLIWLGIKLWRADGTLGNADAAKATRNWFWQGFVVIWSNPKALFFFGALIPQFIDPTGSAVTQTLLLGGTFMVVATCLDSVYALAAGRTGLLLSRRNVRLVEIFGGTCLVGGGLWMALGRR
ncbi:LysE family translocator [Afifella sp. YEN Y35]|uniref:LysE family translocator n=1 Tax=Afifella sp. YEN Y35 TaxID=3388337 RepID=UPI0039E1286F